MKYCLEIKGLYKSFTNHKNDEKTQIFHDLNMKVPKGKISALYGGNGSGKTTLFNSICGLRSYRNEKMIDQGTIIYDNSSIPLNKLKDFQIARSGIGRLFQNSMIFPEMTLKDNLLIADKIHANERPWMSLFEMKKNKEYEKIQEEKIEKLIESVGHMEFLEELNKQVKEFSYGQQRIIEIIRLLVNDDYDLLLLDEPTSGVNSDIYEKISHLIEKLCYEDGKTIFLIEHDKRYIEDNTDHCFFIHDKGIYMEGDSKEIVNHPEVIKRYNGSI